MSGVTALVTSTGGNITGDITLSSTQPGLLSISNTASAPYQINFAPISASVNSLNGKIGAVTLGSSDGLLSVTPDPVSGAIDLKAYNATLNTSGLVANNISGQLAWEGNGASPELSTKAYAIGALVIYTTNTYICVSPQPIGAGAPDVTPAGWEPLPFGATPSSIFQAGTTAEVTSTGDFNITTTDQPGNTNQINLTATLPSTTPGSFPARINISSPTTINLTADYTAGGGTANNIVSITAGGATGRGTVSISSGALSGAMEFNSATGVIVNNNATPPPGGTWATGGFLMAYAGTWSGFNGYMPGYVVQTSTTPFTYFVCIATIAPTTPPATNPAPASDPTHWTQMV